ncbi:hypothetical protein J9317_14065 [Metabacillus sp. KIGAM252]|uniref:Uncharacterized protein n=1 Tax=Metabacillus flavus TaxID=2823519 RepID=A0ABS5LGL4_9BACI|nr:hypothetical protein [Metabacillus flavus]MBS2969894.1 hypothetical protein [Metabacillus flavus]
MPIWQAILITVMLLGMAAYFLHQKASNLLLADGPDDEDEIYEQESYFKAVEKNQLVTAEQESVAVNEKKAEQNEEIDIKGNEDEENLDLDWFSEETPSEKESPIEESITSREEMAEQAEENTDKGNEDEENLNLDWFLEKTPSEKEILIEESLEEAIDDSDEGQGPADINEWFEKLNEEDLLEDEDSEEEANTLDNWDFLNEISEMKENDVVELPAAHEVDDMELAYKSDSDVDEEAPDPSIAEEERKIFDSWFEEDSDNEQYLSKEENSRNYDIDLDILEPVIVNAEEEKEVQDNLEEILMPNPGDEESEKLYGNFLEYKQKGMSDDIFEALYNQLVVLKETSHGHEFNAIMDDVLIQAKGIREYFVFAQLYLNYLAESSQEDKFSNVYREAVEHLQGYPYLTEQLSWTKQKK